MRPFRPSSGTAAGFTLVELLVVCATVAVLAGMLMIAGNMVRERVRSTITANRMEELTRALSGLAAGDQDNGCAATLHERLLRTTAGRGADKFPGVAHFTYDRRNSVFSPVDGMNGAPIETWIPTPYRSWCMQFPWGLPPTDFSDVNATSLPPDGTFLPIEDRGLKDLTPMYTVELMVIAGVLPTENATGSYTADRSDKRSWNDAWGHPLVIGLGLYQPRANTKIFIAESFLRGDQDNVSIQAMGMARSDLFLRRARTKYQFARAFYVAPAAVGRTVRAPITDASLVDPSADWQGASGLLVGLWNQVNDVAGVDDSGDQLWRTDAAITRNPWTNPPWEGVRQRRANGQRCQLAAPVELR